MPAAPARPNAFMAFSFFDNIPNPFRAPDAPNFKPDEIILVAISGFSALALGGGDMGGAGDLDEEAGAGGGNVRPPPPPA